MKFSFLLCFSLLASLFVNACSSSPEVASTPATAVSQEVASSQQEQQIVEQSVVEVESSVNEVGSSEIVDDEIPVFDPNSETVAVPSPAAHVAAASDEDIDENLIRCDTSIQYHDVAYSASAVGPTLEEALDNGTDEACAIPCSDLISETASDAERESVLEECVLQCSSEAVNLAAHCWLHGESILVEGVWSNDSENNAED